MLRSLARLGATRLGAVQRLAPPLLRAAAGPSMLPAPSIAASTFGAFLNAGADIGLCKVFGLVGAVVVVAAAVAAVMVASVVAAVATVLLPLLLPLTLSGVGACR